MSEPPSKPPLVFLVALATGLAALGALAAVAAVWDGWPGVQRTKTLFCEDITHDGLIKQPANTWSNLGFMLVGLLCAWRADRDRREAAPSDNPLRSTRLYPGLFCAVIVFLGPASMALHGSMTGWGGRVDVFSMYMFVGFPLVYGLSRLLRWRDAVFGVALATTYAVAAVGVFWGGADIVLFGACAVGVAVLEVVHARVRRERTHDYRWAVLAIGSFLLAFGIWIPSLTDGPLCDPHSLLQGHALWHLLCAVSVGSVFLYLRSERAAA